MRSSSVKGIARHQHPEADSWQSNDEPHEAQVIPLVSAGPDRVHRNVQDIFRTAMVVCFRVRAQEAAAL